MRSALVLGRAAGVLGFVAALQACSHDLDALRAPNSSASSNAGRGGDTGDAGTAGNAADAAVPDACEPCPPPPAAAEQFGFVSCCRGIAGRECGLALDEGAMCFPRMIPGRPDPACTGLNLQGMRLEGCCRPDARCGLAAAALGLGCVARDDILPASAEPTACRYGCERDADCGVGVSDFVCTEDPRDPSTRICADACRRDADCRAIPGQVCALSSDREMDLIRTVCRSPVGDVQPGDTCAAATDCVHGVCVQSPGRELFCTGLCRGDADCPSGSCISSQISRPSGSSAQAIDICGL